MGEGGEEQKNKHLVLPGISLQFQPGPLPFLLTLSLQDTVRDQGARIQAEEFGPQEPMQTDFCSQHRNRTCVPSPGLRMRLTAAIVACGLPPHISSFPITPQKWRHEGDQDCGRGGPVIQGSDGARPLSTRPLSTQHGDSMCGKAQRDWKVTRPVSHLSLKPRTSKRFESPRPPQFQLSLSLAEMILSFARSW